MFATPRLRLLYHRLAAALACSAAISARANTVNWNVDASGSWTTASNWSPSPPTPASDVTIDRSSGVYTTTVPDAEQIHSLFSNESLSITGSLSVTTTLQMNNLLSLSGTLSNATLTTGAGGSVSFGSGAALDNVTLGSSVAVSNLTILHNLTLANGSLLYGAAGTLSFSNDCTIGGSGTIYCDGSSFNVFTLSSSHNLTLTPFATVYAIFSSANITVANLTNQGSISANSANSTVTINTANLNNSGGLGASGNGTLALDFSTYSGNGTIHVSNATLSLQASISPAFLQNISFSNATLKLAGTILNGNLSLPSGVTTFQTTNGTLNNITLTSNLSFNSSTLNVSNNLTLANATISVTGSGSLSLGGNQTIGGTGTVLLAGTGFLGGSNLTISPTVAITTANNSPNTHVTTTLLDNQGTATAQVTSNLSISAQTAFTNSGTLDAEAGATINASAQTFINTGTIITNGGAINLGGGNFTNSGAIIVSGSVSVNPTNFTNFSAGVLSNGTWIVRSFSALHLSLFSITTNAANITLDGANSNINDSGTTSVLSNFNLNSGAFTITNGRNLSVPAFTNSGNLTIGPNSTFSAPQLLLNGGLLAGTGNVAASVIAGNAPHTIHPGLPNSSISGTLTLSSLSTNANTTLAFNLASPAAASLSQNDKLVITNSLSLNGGSVQFTSAGPASLGYYTLIQAPSPITNTTSLLLPASTNTNIVYTLDTSRDPNALDLHIGFLGDANDDGHVDLSDLSTVLNNFGTSATSWTSGNFDNAPTIDLTDLSDVLNNFGATNPNPTATPTPTPEPASLYIAANAMALLMRRRRS